MAATQRSLTVTQKSVLMSLGQLPSGSMQLGTLFFRYGDKAQLAADILAGQGLVEKYKSDEDQTMYVLTDAGWVEWYLLKNFS